MRSKKMSEKEMLACDENSCGLVTNGLAASMAAI
jgi:hypothetical protein